MKTFKQFLEESNISNNQAFAASKGKYYSSSDKKTYPNYNAALAARNSRLNKLTQRSINMANKDIATGNEARYTRSIPTNSYNPTTGRTSGGVLAPKGNDWYIKKPDGATIKARNIGQKDIDRYQANTGGYTVGVLGGNTSFKAGGGEAGLNKARLTNPNYTRLNVQARGLDALRRRENTPNTAAGFDTAFASARKLGQKTFNWRGGSYTTDMAG